MAHDLLDGLERNPPATDDALRELAEFAGAPLPADYVAFLRESDGARGAPREALYIDLWSARDVIGTTLVTREGREPNQLLFFGGDGSREMLCFDLASHPPEVLLLDITYASTDDSPWRIRGFTALLDHLATHDLFDPPA